MTANSEPVSYVNKKDNGADRNHLVLSAFPRLVILTAQQRNVVFSLDYPSLRMSVLIRMSGRLRRSITC